MAAGEDPEHPPKTRRWRCERLPDEPWAGFVRRAAAHARTMLRELVGEARATAAGTIHVDLAWVTEDELALFDLPGWIRRDRRALVEQGGVAWAWRRRASWRMTCAGRSAPGSFYGVGSADLAQIPADARFAAFTPRAKNAARAADLALLEVLHASACTDATLPHLAGLPSLRELFLVDDTRLTSLAPISGLSALELAYIDGGRRLTDFGPLRAMPRLRYLQLVATGLRDLSTLAGLAQVTSLHLSTGNGAVDSLAPLGALTGLRHLSAWTAAVRDPSLAPLAALRNLRSLEISPNRFPLEELAALAAALPGVEGTLRSPFVPHPDGTGLPPSCKRCGRAGTYLTLGKPQRELCPDCDAGAIRQHVIRWEILLSAAAATRAGSSQAT